MEIVACPHCRRFLTMTDIYMHPNFKSCPISATCLTKMPLYVVGQNLFSSDCVLLRL
jgi:uncharacterized protein YbaR (Trm112 family)